MPKYIVEAESIKDLLDGFYSIQGELVLCSECVAGKCEKLQSPLYIWCDDLQRNNTHNEFCSRGRRKDDRLD